MSHCTSSSKFSVDLRTLSPESVVLKITSSVIAQVAALPPSPIGHVAISSLVATVWARKAENCASSSLISVFCISRACIAASPPPPSWLALKLALIGDIRVWGLTLFRPFAKNVDDGRCMFIKSGRLCKSSEMSPTDKHAFLLSNVSGRSGTGGGPGLDARGKNPSQVDLLFSITVCFLKGEPPLLLTWSARTASKGTAPILFRFRVATGKSSLTSCCKGVSIWAIIWSKSFLEDSGSLACSNNACAASTWPAATKEVFNPSLSVLDWVGGKTSSDLSARSLSNFGFGGKVSTLGSLIWATKSSCIFRLILGLAGESSKPPVLTVVTPLGELGRLRLLVRDKLDIWFSGAFSDAKTPTTFPFPSSSFSPGPVWRASHLMYPSASVSSASGIKRGLERFLGKDLLRMLPSSLVIELVLVSDSLDIFREWTGSEMWIGSAVLSESRSM